MKKLNEANLSGPQTRQQPDPETEEDHEQKIKDMFDWFSSNW